MTVAVVKLACAGAWLLIAWHVREAFFTEDDQ